MPISLLMLARDDDAIATLGRREDAERFMEEVGATIPRLASDQRIEERELDSGETVAIDSRTA